MSKKSSSQEEFKVWVQEITLRILTTLIMNLDHNRHSIYGLFLIQDYKILKSMLYIFVFQFLRKDCSLVDIDDK